MAALRKTVATLPSLPGRLLHRAVSISENTWVATALPDGGDAAGETHGSKAKRRAAVEGPDNG
jgi:hypothetical protein